MEILKRLNAHDIVCSVLTKGLLPIELEKLNKKNQYGITVITLDDDFRKKMEPGASQINERIKSLRALHEKGCKTWVSIEPYPTPNFIKQNLKEILEGVNFTDKIIFGRISRCLCTKNINSFTISVRKRSLVSVMKGILNII